MPKSVDQAGAVKSISLKDLLQVIPNLGVILPVGDIRPDIIHHLNDFDIGSAVPWAFQ